MILAIIGVVALLLAVVFLIGGGAGGFLGWVLNRFGRRGEYAMALGSNIVTSLLVLLALPYAVFSTVDDRSYLKACFVVVIGACLGFRLPRDWRQCGAIRAAVHADNATVEHAAELDGRSPDAP